MSVCFWPSRGGTLFLASLLVSSCVKPNADFDPFRVDNNGTSQANETSTPASSADTGVQTQTEDEAASSPPSTSTQTDSSSPSSTSQSTGNSNTTSTTTSETTDASAQDCTPTLCHALNDLQPAISTAFAVAGRTATAFQLNADRRVLRIEIFTGERAQASRLAIWNNSGSDPGSELVGQGWTINSMNQWQGVNFEPAFSISGNTRYWVVWDPPPNAQANLASAGDFPTHKFQADGQTVWQSQSVRPMLRIYCCQP